VSVVELGAPGAFPLPDGRGLWRLMLYGRQYSSGVAPASVAVAELTSARGRRLDQAWNSPATLTFTLDGASADAALVHELAQDVVSFRLDDQTGADVAVFRGPITQAEDQVTEQANTVTFTAHDYLALLPRRINTTAIVATAVDQDAMLGLLITPARAPQSSSGTSFGAGGYLPITWANVNPDGTLRGTQSGQLRDRTYPASTDLGQAVDDLAKVINGFDYDIVPALRAGGNQDQIRNFYPYQGVPRSTPALIYGSTVTAFTRAVDSGAYANYQRIIGNNGASDPAAAQLFAEAWNSDALNGTAGAVGLWMAGDNASDVTIMSTLTQKAQGDLALSGVLTPAYTVTMRPGAYNWGAPNMGDVVPLVIQTGRLNVSTTVRVLGISYDIGDDGQEDVGLTLGRPLTTLADLFIKSAQGVDALARR
jgi:hypothetical protein